MAVVLDTYGDKRTRYFERNVARDRTVLSWAAPTLDAFSYDVNRQLRVGLIATNGHPDGIRRNTVAGFDAVWRSSEFRCDKNFLVGAWTAFSAGDIPPGNRAGWGFKIDYPNDLWDCATSLNDFGEAPSPGLGFLPRPGTRQFVASCQYKPRPSKYGRFGWVRQAKFQHRFTRVTNHLGQVE